MVIVLFSVACTAQAVDTQKQVYHGNTDSKIFHQSSCRYFNCKNCTKVFDSRDAAIDAGYRPCKVCKPLKGRAK